MAGHNTSNIKIYSDNYSIFNSVKRRIYGKTSFTNRLSQCFKRLINSLKSKPAVQGSELTISFHNSDPRYENGRNSLEVVRRFCCTGLADRSCDAQLNSKTLWGQFEFMPRIDLYVPKLSSSSLWSNKVLEPFMFNDSSYDCSYLSWRVRSDRSCILSGKFPVSKIHGANVGPAWGRQDPSGPHVGHTKLAIWVIIYLSTKVPHQRATLNVASDKTIMNDDLDFESMHLHLRCSPAPGSIRRGCIHSCTRKNRPLAFYPTYFDQYRTRIDGLLLCPYGL